MARLVGVSLVLVAIMAAFFAGVYLGREEARPLTVLADSLLRENLDLNDQLSALRADKAALERSQRLDQETLLSAQEGLKKEQEGRLVLEKDLAAIKRLIRQGGGGILRIQDFSLGAAGEDGLFEYHFTVRQLIPDYPESQAKAAIKLVGKRKEKAVNLALDRLPDSGPGSVDLKFKHFQQIDGKIKVPADLDPDAVVIDIQPISKMLIPTSESFPWPAMPESHPEAPAEAEPGG